MTITLEQYRRMEEAGQIKRPLTDGPMVPHRPVSADGAVERGTVLPKRRTWSGK